MLWVQEREDEALVIKAAVRSRELSRRRASQGTLTRSALAYRKNCRPGPDR